MPDSETVETERGCSNDSAKAVLRQRECGDKTETHRSEGTPSHSHNCGKRQKCCVLVDE